MAGFGLGVGLGADFRSDTGQPPPPATPTHSFGLAANRGYLPMQVKNGALGLTYRSEHWASPQGDVAALKPVWTGIHYSNTSWLIAAGPSAYTIEASIEYPAGVFQRLTFAGAASGVVPADGFLVADAADLTIPAGARFWIRTYVVSIATGSQISVWQIPGVSNLVGLTDGAVTGNRLLEGTINPSATGNVHGPLAIMGRVSAANVRGFLIQGDSVNWGQGDDTGVGVKGGAGIIARALDPLYPWVMLARTSGLVTNIAGSANSLSRLGALRSLLEDHGGITDIISNYGINDLKTGSSVAQVRAAITTLFSAFPGARCYQTTLGPRTTSASNDWTAYPGDQVPRTDGQWANFPLFNQGVRAGIGGATGHIEVGDFLQPSRDAGYWLGHSPAWTADGTHPSTAGAAAVAAMITIA